MKSRVRNLMSTISVIVALILPICLPAQEQQRAQKKHPPFYAVTDLGTLDGMFSVARGLNSRVWTVGGANVSEDAATHAFLWRDGLMSDLGTFGGTNSLAFALNTNGQVVGQAESPIPDPFGVDFCFNGTQLQCLPFLWQNGVMTSLPTLGGNNGIANGINDMGVVSGQAENSTFDSTCGSPKYESKPVLWKDDVAQELPNWVGDPDGYVWDINNNGQAVGASGPCLTENPPLHAVLWHNGTVTDLGNLGGDFYAEAFAINDHGQVLGTSDVPGDTFAGPYSTAHGFLWKNGKIRDLGTIPGTRTVSLLLSTTRAERSGLVPAQFFGRTTASGTSTRSCLANPSLPSICLDLSTSMTAEKLWALAWRSPASCTRSWRLPVLMLKTAKGVTPLFWRWIQPAWQQPILGIPQ
jgi:probable HAF family extracellular repeat protein